jgi:hypothetical protein
MSFFIAPTHEQERRPRMFYKSTSRSTVLERHQTVRNDHINPVEDEVVETQLIEAQRRSEALNNHKLSAFEKELLQAWWQD